LRQVDCLPPSDQGEWKISLSLYEELPFRLAGNLQHVCCHPEIAESSNVLLNGTPMRADLFLPRQRVSPSERQIGYGLWIDSSRSIAKQAWALTCFFGFSSGGFGMLSGVYAIFQLYQLHQPTLFSKTLNSCDGFPWMDIDLETLSLWMAMAVPILLAYQCIVRVWPRKLSEAGDDHSRRQTLKPTEWVNVSGGWTAIRNSEY
jgi:hypothetical protein